MATRQDILARYQANPNISVLIIGGGVNGISTFRELALQGVDVLLVDKNDFCSGASAGSSHMAHGGLRYLENAEFRLVREALLERNRLLKNAPHCVYPLPTTIPIFHWLSGTLNAPLKFLGLSHKSSNRGAFIIKIGLTFYDWFARAQRSMPTHKIISKKKSLEIRPKLHPDIICTASYYDSWIKYPERLCVEMILDTEAQAEQAHALNYVSFEAGAGDNVTLKDQVSGQTFAVKPQVVINAAGPWIDFVNQDITEKTSFIGGTKGAHLIIDNADLFASTAGSEMFFENRDGRITLFFPYVDKVMAGTTDIPVGNPDDVTIATEEVDYILNSVKMVFPSIEVKPEEIVFQFTGVRPLPTSDADRPGQVSRDHSIKVMEAGNGINFPIYALIGGKWTTFRAFGEQTADKVLARLGKERTVGTEDMAIGGGKDYPTTEDERARWITTLHEKTGIPAERIALLLERYGTRAADFTAFMSVNADIDLKHVPNYSRRELHFLATREKLVHLDDFLLRRSLLAILGHINQAGIAEVADVFAEALGWTVAQKQVEIERTTQRLRDFHKMAL